MATLVQLPGGNTALFRDSDELSNRQVKELRRAARRVGLVSQKLRDLGFDPGVAADEKADDDDRNERAMAAFSHLDDDDDDALDLFQRTAVTVRIKEWTLGIPLPTTPEEVDDLPRPLYAALTTEAAKLDLTEDFSRDGIADPKADTEN